MARTVKPLSDSTIKKAKPKEKEYKLFDGGGLHIVIKPTGSKLWRIKYRLNGKEKSKSLGKYPFVSLHEARAKLQEIKKQLSDGNDPNEKKKEVQQKQVHLFSDVAAGYLAFKVQELAHSYYIKQARRVEIYINPIIGDINIDEIVKSDIIRLIKNIAKVNTRSSKPDVNKAETARIVFNLLEQIFRWGLHNDMTTNPVMQTIDKNALIPKKEVIHYNAVTDEKEIKQIFSMIEEYRGESSTKNALKFLALSGLRSGNVRGLKWEYVDFEKEVIIFPKEVMKTKIEFRLPITQDVKEILDDMQHYTSGREYVFCSIVSKTKPLSENTLGYALKRMEILNHTPHGFRSSFSTLCYENQKKHGFSGEVIEAQLAHAVGGKVKLAYLRSDFLEERRELMQWWANFLRS